jgi:hypothetical protein
VESQNTLDRASNGLQLILDPLGIPFGYNLMRFLVRTWYSTPIKLPDSGLTLMFADENIEVKLHNTVSTEGFHLGIAAQSVLEANTHDHATEQAVGAVNNVIVLLSLTASAAAEDTGNRWTIDLDEATTTRTLVQHFARVPTRVPKSRPIDEPLLQRIAQRWGPTLLASPSTAARLKRALWHLQKSNLTDDLVEQFAEL